MFALHMAHGMSPDMFEDQEWELFTGQLLGGSRRRSSMGGNTSGRLPSWIPRERIGQVSDLISAFPQLDQALDLANEAMWGTFVHSASCEKEIPSEVRRKIRPFQQVLLVQAIRPDCLQSAMSDFACTALETSDLSPPNLNLKSLYESESRPGEPIMFVTSPGADPSVELQDFASATIGLERFHEVAMGQGQAQVGHDLRCRPLGGRTADAGDVTGSGKLDRARSRLYRSQILQVNMRLKALVRARFQLYRSQNSQESNIQNMRWKALAEIYTMHSFAQL